jgi:hypothetical protein
MKHRKLRIAWSVAWGIVAVLFVAVWVRSYWWADNLTVRLTDRHTISIGSILGGVAIRPWLPTTGPVNWWTWFNSEWYGEPPQEWKMSRVAREKFAYVAYHEGTWPDAKTHPPKWFGFLNHGTTIRLPYLGLVGCTSLFAALPWFRYRFTLRTLLISTTLVAVGLGLIVWLEH